MVACYALRGSTGFGAAAAMPLLALVIPLKVLIPAWTLIGLTAGVTLLGRDRAHIAWSAMGRLWLSGLIGIAIGLYVFTALDGRTLAQGLGGLILLYGLYSCGSRPGRRRAGRPRRASSRRSRARSAAPSAPPSEPWRACSSRSISTSFTWRRRTSAPA